MLRQWRESIWLAEQPLRFLGLEMGARMTVVKVSDNCDLLVHSPIRPNRELLSALNKLGQVRYIVAPNLLHHLFAAEFRANFPEATLYGVLGLEKKNKSLVLDETLIDGKAYPWSSTLEHRVVQGIPKCNEVVFYHRHERALLVTDLGIHICKESPFLTRCVFALMGMLNTFGWSGLEKRLFIKNGQAFAESVESILRWDFESILLAHGRIVEKKGNELFRAAFQTGTKRQLPRRV